MLLGGNSLSKEILPILPISTASRKLEQLELVEDKRVPLMPTKMAGRYR